MKKFVNTFYTAMITTLASGMVYAQTMPSTPLPTGVTSGNNPIDTGVNLMKYAAKYGFVGISLLCILFASYVCGPTILEWVNGRKKFGEASGTIVGGLILAIFGVAVATYGFNAVGGGAAAP